ncbi:hypothetical protein PLESTM_000676700 [Pleodorina starrii]|nr:hypothetical protein PLESTM_000676700 [Pleodorina starrii]
MQPGCSGVAVAVGGSAPEEVGAAGVVLDPAGHQLRVEGLDLSSVQSFRLTWKPKAAPPWYLSHAKKGLTPIRQVLRHPHNLLVLGSTSEVRLYGCTFCCTGFTGGAAAGYGRGCERE